MKNPIRAFFARRRRRPIRVFYDEAFRLPLSSAEAGPSIEIRRADDAVHYLLHEDAVDAGDVVSPEAISYEALGRVHTPEYLESLHDPATLARIFAVDPSDVYGDELLRTVRLGCGGTLEAARWTLAHGHAALNTLGGFHHAAPDRGAGFCAVNDFAVAIACLRQEGFTGRVGVIDLDFHPPDGTAACLGKDPSVWLGSISGTSWGQLDGVDETVLPEGAGDTEYLAATSALLSRMPPHLGLVFVLAGADVLAGDRLGTLALSLGGVRRRDLLVAQRLGRTPQVWLPAGGYSSYAWKVLAGAGLVLAFDSEEAIPLDYDPLAARMSGIARTLSSESLGEELKITEDDVTDALRLPREGPVRLLNFYTPEGLEHALERYRLLPLIRRMGYRGLRATIDRVGSYDRARMVATDSTDGREVVLIELEVERRRLGGRTYLFINWLSLRNPRAKFSSLRPQLPGQEVPGLGLAKEMSHLLGLMSKRLGLDGVAFRPSWYHMAFAARHSARFVDPVRQGRFEALVRDLRDMPLLEATHAVAEGRVRCNGEHWAWEAEEMVRVRDTLAEEPDAVEIAAVREASHFTIAPA
jgi:acetoin utilization deacetylase AcuC-like enzyme